MSTPPLPAGYALDQSAPPLPAGYSLDQSAATEEKPSTYSKLTAGYNPDVEEWAQKHPIAGPVVRFLDSVGGAVASLPESTVKGLSDMLASQATGGLQRTDTSRALEESIRGWSDPNVRKNALSVLPEALGQGVGSVAGGEIAGKVIGKTSAAVKEVLPSVETVKNATGSALRNAETNRPILPLKVASHVTKYIGGPEVLNDILPDNPKYLASEAAAEAETLAAKQAEQEAKVAAKQEAADRKPVPVSKNPTPGGYTGPASAKAAAKASEPQVVSPEAAPLESEGRPATWTNDYVLQRSAKGDVRAIQQARLRGLNLPPNAGMVADKGASVPPSLNTPKSVTIFDAEGKPINGTESQAQPGIRIENAMGVRWAVSPDGKYRVSVPNSIPDNLVESYATPRLAMQAQQHASLLRQ